MLRKPYTEEAICNIQHVSFCEETSSCKETIGFKKGHVHQEVQGPNG
jgi:hypothetical protein